MYLSALVLLNLLYTYIFHSVAQKDVFPLLFVDQFRVSPFISQNITNNILCRTHCRSSLSTTTQNMAIRKIRNTLSFAKKTFRITLFINQGLIPLWKSTSIWSPSSQSRSGSVDISSLVRWPSFEDQNSGQRRIVPKIKALYFTSWYTRNSEVPRKILNCLGKFDTVIGNSELCWAIRYCSEEFRFVAKKLNTVPKNLRLSRKIHDCPA